MDPIVFQYIAFVVAALILIWATLELRRYMHKRTGPSTHNTWVRLDTTRPTVVEELLPIQDDEDQEESPEPTIQTRAKQNGHSSESKMPL